MKALIMLAGAGAFVLTGCMRTYDLTRAVPEESPFEVRSRILDETVTIEKLDGTKTMGTVTAFGPDSVRYTDENSGKSVTLPSGAIATISSSPGAGGPILGLLGGGLVGAGIGGLVGVSEPTSNNVVGAIIEPVANSVNGAIVGAAIGAPVGLLVGSALTPGRKYIFHRETGVAATITLVIGREDLVSETETSVTFRYQGKNRTAPKTIADVSREGNRVRIVLPRAYIED
jgi:hypothetical protein